LYLAGLKDLSNGELEGYTMSAPMTKDLVMRALFRATSIKRPATGLVLPSDRGSQDCARNYQRLLKQFGMISSMNRKGGCVAIFGRHHFALISLILMSF
jgi:putative transposase